MVGYALGAGFLRLFSDLVVALDGLFQKRLAKVIPNLDHLLADPANTLASEKITIGPAKPYSSATFIGLLLSIPVWIVILLVIPDLSAINPPNPRTVFLVRAELLLALVLVPAILSYIMVRILRGGTCVLSTEGVELIYHRKVVFCPWAFFNVVEGNPVRPRSRKGRALFPFNSSAVPFLKLWKQHGAYDERRLDGLPPKVIAEGAQVRTPQLKFARNGYQVVLKDLYVVPVKEVGNLLLQLGGTLKEANFPDHNHLR